MEGDCIVSQLKTEFNELFFHSAIKNHRWSWRFVDSLFFDDIPPGICWEFEWANADLSCENLIKRIVQCAHSPLFFLLLRKPPQSWKFFEPLTKQIIFFPRKSSWTFLTLLSFRLLITDVQIPHLPQIPCS